MLFRSLIAHIRLECKKKLNIYIDPLFVWGTMYIETMSEHANAVKDIVTNIYPLDCKIKHSRYLSKQRTLEFTGK